MKIFWKIFLGFWLSSFLMLISSILVSQWFFNSEPVRLKYLVELNELVQQLETQGAEFLKQRAEKNQLPHSTNIVILHANKLIYPEKISWWDWQLVEQLNSVEPELQQQSPQGYIFGRYLKNSVGQEYKLLVKSQENVSGKLAGRRILALLLVSGLVCYGLARYIASPIKKVSSVARRLSAGDLKARVNIKSNSKSNIKSNKRRSKKRIDEIQQLADDFDGMADHLEQQIRDQQLLLRDVSHELRSPLARLQIAVELARQHQVSCNEDSSEHNSKHNSEQEFKRIIKEVDALDHLISQLLELPRLESGTVQLDESIDIPTLIQFIIDDCQFEATAQQKNITLFCDCDSILVQGNGEALHSAIENIVRNAIRHTPAKSSIHIHLKKAANELLLTVRDYGCGVPANDLEKIFEPFYRVSDARERRSGGSGIGLAIALRAIKLHGGTIQAANKQPGLEIAIKLPVFSIDTIIN